MENKYYKIENNFYKVIVSITTDLSEKNISFTYEYIIKSKNGMVKDIKVNNSDLISLDFSSEIYSNTEPNFYESLAQDFLKNRLEQEILSLLNGSPTNILKQYLMDNLNNKFIEIYVDDYNLLKQSLNKFYITTRK